MCAERTVWATSTWVNSTRPLWLPFPTLLERSEDTCDDYILVEGGKSDTFQYNRPWCTLRNNESNYDMVEGDVRVYLSVSPPFSSKYTGVNIAFTTYRRGDACDERVMFTCASSRVCISKQWTCNGINNCGDDSDEPKQFTTEGCRMDPEYVWGPVLFTTILVVFVGVLVYVVVFDIFKSRVSLSTDMNSSSTTSLDAFAPA
ncbi:uncharacterized protein LOC135378283 isoform X2 [Ornithodoros turicata]|uniref:uncharacterized protein LOC135378283 isoform X2 n=1 Tax=Ornithodoros turicata TaxID=34597 RepID=UPI003138623B